MKSQESQKVKPETETETDDPNINDPIEGPPVLFHSNFRIFFNLMRQGWR